MARAGAAVGLQVPAPPGTCYPASVSAPESEAELFARARALAGQSVLQVARAAGRAVPGEMLRAKGFVGGLVEQVLGASAGSRAEPDFPTLGVELKTLPVSSEGRPLESTNVCTLPPREMLVAEYATSLVRKKLARVLWVPVEGSRALPLAERRFGEPLLWSPDAAEEAVLRADWELIAERFARGQADTITGHLGVALQMRPKAASSRARRLAYDEDGATVLDLPRGFYLRASFTREIVRRGYAWSRD